MRKSIVTAAALAVILTAAAAAFAAAPGRITYQGTLRKDGRLFSGTAAMVFRITDASLSAEYWTSGSTDVFVSTGLFRYPLGTPNEAAFDAIPWKDITPYVQVSLEGGWLPAEPLYSSVYSFHSVTSESSTGTFTVNGGDLVIDGAGTHGIIFSDGTSQYAAPGWKAAVSGTQTSFGGSAALGRSSAGTRLDVQGAASDDYVQIWRDSSGLITSSMTASGVIYADASRMRNMPSGADGLGGHTASQALDMAGFPINAAGGVTSSGQITTASSVTVVSPLGLVSHRVGLAPGVEVSSETSSALGGGVRVSSNVYIVGFSSAARYYGDGSQLTGITAGMTGIESDPGQFSGDGAGVGTRLALRSSSVTLRGNAFNAANQLVLLDGAGSLAVGSGASVSTLSAAGFLGLATLTGQPSGAGAGALYYNSQAFDGEGALYVNLNGAFVPLATGTVAGGGGFSGVISDGDQFDGDGAGVLSKLALKSSSVTLQGNTFNAANRLVLLDGDGKLPGLDGSALVNMAGDDLGDHTATQDLDLASYGITGVSTITASGITISSYGLIQTAGPGLGGVVGDARGLGAVDLQAYRDDAAQVASGEGAVISGGTSNTAAGPTATVGGGRENVSSTLDATISGGYGNLAAGATSVVGGGSVNTASGAASVVGGGVLNIAGGQAAVVPGGYGNSALGEYSFAAGYASSSTASGAFTWSDSEGAEVRNTILDRTVFKNRGGFMVTPLSGVLDANLAMLDVVSTGTAADVYAQVWRDSDGVVKASMTADGKFYADISGATGFPSGDDLGDHNATQRLNLAGNAIVAVSSITVSSITGEGGLVYIAKPVSVNGGAVLSGDVAVGAGASVSTLSAAGFLGLATLTGQPSGAGAGALYYNSQAFDGEGALYVNLNGAFVPLATGTVAGGGSFSGVISDGDQFNGDGAGVGTKLALKPSSVTLQGNAFNAANQLVLLDGDGSLAVGSGASVSTLSAAGFLGLASLTGQPGGAGAGALYYNSQAFDGAGALYIRLNSDFVPIATGTVAGGGGSFSGVISDDAQFSGDGAGTSLTLRSSSVTLQGNTFNVANRLVLLDGNGKLPAIDGSQLTGIEGGGGGSGTCANPGNPDDIMVQVGDYCVDKYEATVWSSVLADGTQYGASADDYPCSDDGSSCLPAGTPIYALSLPGFAPSASITWFQASAACANSGKHLISNAEWQAAVAGTPTGGYGSPPNCNVGLEAPTTTGGGTSCLSAWGVENMVGSLWEMVAEWEDGDTETVMRVRGGSFNSPGEAGPTVMAADNTPTDFDSAIGFRCAMNLR